MKINKQIRFYVYLKNKLGRNADLLNFFILQELGTGKYVLPDLCKQLEVSRSNFNASLIRLKKAGVISYSGHSSNGILLWWIKKSVEDEADYKTNAPRWVIVNKDNRKLEEFIFSLLTTTTAGVLIKNALKPKKPKLTRPISTPEIY